MTRPWYSHYDQQVPWFVNYPDISLPKLLENSLAMWGDRICLRYLDRLFSYREVSQQVEDIAYGLICFGLQKGERVLLCLPNIPEFVASYFGILSAGGVVVATNPLYKLPEIHTQIVDAGCRYVIGHSGNQILFETIMDSTSLKGVIYVDVDPNQAQPFKDSRELQMVDIINLGKSRKIDLPNVSAGDPAVFQYSGGTTGNPKAAIGLHRNLVANAYQFRSWLVDLQDGKEKVLLAIPLYHVYGMVLGLCVGILLGAELILQPDPRDVKKILHLLKHHNISFFPSVPAMLTALVRDPDVQAEKYDLRSLRACISGSAPLQPDTRIQFVRLTGANVMEGYGLSEAPTATHCNPMRGEKRDGSIGLPLPGVDCRIVDFEGRDIDLLSGEAGELWIKGPQVMAGYHNQPDETADVLQNGWLRTGDIVRMDEDGYFFIVDRKKDLIKVGGLQVWPREIEEVLLSHPAIAEAAVAGIPDQFSGERAKAWVVLKKGVELSQEELIHWCGERLSSYKLPREIEYVESLPRTTVGKILRRELVRNHIQKNQTPPR